MSRFGPLDIMSLTAEHVPHDLAESLTPALRLRELLDVADADPLAQLELGYGSPAGAPGLRALLAQQHQVEADDVVVTAGGMHALFLLVFQTCSPGGHAIVTQPMFPLVRGALDAVGAKVSVSQQSFDGRYELDVADLQSRLTRLTRLVYLATPQNPSGVAIPAATIETLAQTMLGVCPDAVLVVDETYRTASFGTVIPPSLAGCARNVVVTSSLSKLHGAAGLRVGWAITTNKPLRDRILHAKYGTTISCSVLDETLAQRILAEPAIAQGQRNHLAGNRAIAANWIASEPQVEWVAPDGGGLCCVRLKSHKSEDAGQRLRLAFRAAGGRVANGEWFGDTTDVFRLGFGYLEPEDLTTALDALSDALNASPDP